MFRTLKCKNIKRLKNFKFFMKANRDYSDQRNIYILYLSFPVETNSTRSAFGSVKYCETLSRDVFQSMCN